MGYLLFWPFCLSGLTQSSGQTVSEKEWKNTLDNCKPCKLNSPAESVESFQFGPSWFMHFTHRWAKCCRYHYCTYTVAPQQVFCFMQTIANFYGMESSRQWIYRMWLFGTITEFISVYRPFMIKHDNKFRFSRFSLHSSSDLCYFHFVISVHWHWRDRYNTVLTLEMTRQKSNGDN